jgi:small basic protein
MALVIKKECAEVISLKECGLLGQVYGRFFIPASIFTAQFFATGVLAEAIVYFGEDFGCMAWLGDICRGKHSGFLAKIAVSV